MIWEESADAANGSYVLSTLAAQFEAESDRLLRAVAHAAGAFQATTLHLSGPATAQEVSAALRDTAASAETLSCAIDDVLWSMTGSAGLVRQAITRSIGDGPELLGPEFLGPARIATLAQEIEVLVVEIAGHASLLALNTTVEAAHASRIGTDPAAAADMARSIVDHAVQTTESIAWRTAKVLQYATRAGAMIAAVLCDLDHRDAARAHSGAVRAA